MPGFGDVAQAIQFGLGLAGGFAAQSQRERQSRRAEQIQLLRLLHSQGQRFTNVPLSDIDRPTGFFDKAFGTGEATQRGTGAPAFVIGNQGFVTQSRFSSPSGGLNALIGSFPTGTAQSSAIDTTSTDLSPGQPAPATRRQGPATARGAAPAQPTEAIAPLTQEEINADPVLSDLRRQLDQAGSSEKRQDLLNQGRVRIKELTDAKASRGRTTQGQGPAPARGAAPAQPAEQPLTQKELNANPLLSDIRRQIDLLPEGSHISGSPGFETRQDLLRRGTLLVEKQMDEKRTRAITQARQAFTRQRQQKSDQRAAQKLERRRKAFRDIDNPDMSPQEKIRQLVNFAGQPIASARELVKGQEPTRDIKPATAVNAITRLIAQKQKILAGDVLSFNDAALLALLKTSGTFRQGGASAADLFPEEQSAGTTETARARQIQALDAAIAFYTPFAPQSFRQQLELGETPAPQASNGTSGLRQAMSQAIQQTEQELGLNAQDLVDGSDDYQRFFSRVQALLPQGQN